MGCKRNQVVRLRTHKVVITEEAVGSQGGVSELCVRNILRHLLISINSVFLGKFTGVCRS